jgi:hypothetical protein
LTVAIGRGGSPQPGGDSPGMGRLSGQVVDVVPLKASTL